MTEQQWRDRSIRMEMVAAGIRSDRLYSDLTALQNRRDTFHKWDPRRIVYKFAIRRAMRRWVIAVGLLNTARLRYLNNTGIGEVK